MNAVILEVHPNPELRNVVAAPAVPLPGLISVRGASGTVHPGDVVQVKNRRSGASVGAIADTTGAFELAIVAEAGDEMLLLAIRLPTVIQARTITPISQNPSTED